MTIKLAIGGSRYEINCPASEEEKLLRLAKNLNAKVNNLSLSMRGSDEKTLLVIAALATEEELEKLNIIADENENENEDDVDGKMNTQDLYDAVSENMENIADYIEKLITKIQNY